MKRHLGFVMRSSIFLILLFTVLLLITQIALPKSYFNMQFSGATMPNTASCRGFYEMERDSVDVLFLGSSHCMTSFNIQHIYDTYGVRSYSIGTQQQNLVVSYFWLKEALRFQHPKVVVLDTYICFPYSSEPLNSPEATLRLAIDPMEWSGIKMEAIAAICQYDSSQEAVSYYNPMIRFHDRWSGVNEDDFTFFELDDHFEMKGYTMLATYSRNQTFQPFEAGSSEQQANMVPLMEEYLDKIVALCKEKGIELILVNTPAINSNAERYNRMYAYAQAHQVEYYDFNESVLYNEIGFEFSVDSADHGHPNYWGAKKISNKMGEILTSGRYRVPAVYDEQWESSRDFYEKTARNAQLRHITDIVEYLDALRQDTYTIFIAVKDDASSFMSSNIMIKLQQLGVSIDLMDKYQSSYYAVITSLGEVLEEHGEMSLSAQGSFRDGRNIYSISSAGRACGNNCSIMIDNKEYAKKQRGLNIVVYDNVYRKVVDCVCFDTGAETLDAIR